jgi:Protein of unknown function, DUF481
MSITPKLTQLFTFLFAAELLLCCSPCDCQTQTAKDNLLLENGEKLIGKLQRSTGTKVFFHSDTVGDVTVDWSKIQELQSSQKFAVVQKGVKLQTNETGLRIPQCTVSVSDGHVLVNTAPNRPPLTLSLANTQDVIDLPTFEKVVLSRPAWYQNWKGSGTVGLTLVQATQQNQSYTSSVNFLRDIPGENWMDPETRTILTFTSSYGELSQPDTPTVKTSIFHAQGERDKYFSPRLYSFLEAGFDHDYSQGLNLQQTYGSGIGWSTLKSADEQLDLRAAVVYENQSFFTSSQNQHLISSLFSESYNRKFQNKITFHEDLSITPAWSNLNAYSGTGTVTLTIPIYKKISYTLGVTDSFINNPSPGYRKNSFQFLSGVTYTLP